MTAETKVEELEGMELSKLHMLYMEAYKNRDYEETTRIFNFVRENFYK